MSKLTFVTGLVALAASQALNCGDKTDCCLHPNNVCYQQTAAVCALYAGTQFCDGTGPKPPTPQPTPVPTPPPTPVPTPPPPTKPPTPQPTPPPATPPTPAPPSNGQKLVVYYESWATYGRNYQVSDMDFDTMTHVNFAFANVNRQGDVIIGDSYADLEKTAISGECSFAWDEKPAGNIGCLIKMKQKYPHITTMISVGGWTWSTYFSLAARTPASRARFAQSAAKYMADYQFDGLDLDWEYPVAGGLPACDGIPSGQKQCNVYHPSDKENYVKLLQACREELVKLGNLPSGERRPLTIASTPDQRKLQNNHEMNKLVAVLDWVNIMTYDYNGGWQPYTGHNTPLVTPDYAYVNIFSLKSTVDFCLSGGRDPKKFVLGMGTYGRGWQGVTHNSRNGMHSNATGPMTPGTWGTDAAGVFDYKDIVAKYQGGDWQVYWDDVSKVPFTYNKRAGKLISYDDERSIEIKSNWACGLHGMAGGMIWAASSDLPKSNSKSLQKIIHRLCVQSTSTPTCNYGAWSSWGACDVTCGEGTQTRTRSASGSVCFDTSETRVCQAGACPAPTCNDSTQNGDEDGVDCGGSCPTPCPVNYPAWVSGTAYSGGAKVSHNGKDWEAKWWTQAEPPSDAWKEI